ncbi:MAG TPA: hypothetical protein VM347_10340 [Nonomuraea sp.]|nr:hypothetical protein [Nonomuraea sp.]
MKAWIAQAVGLALVAQAGSAIAQSTSVVTCVIERSSPIGAGAMASIVREDRLFRIEPGHLEEWEPAEGRFGPNLCDTSTCKSNGEHSEATIASASGAYTITVDHLTGIGFWRSLGSSGPAANMGFCYESPDPSEPPEGIVASLSSRGPLESVAV